MSRVRLLLFFMSRLTVLQLLTLFFTSNLVLSRPKIFYEL